MKGTAVPAPIRIDEGIAGPAHLPIRHCPPGYLQCLPSTRSRPIPASGTDRRYAVRRSPLKNNTPISVTINAWKLGSSAPSPGPAYRTARGQARVHGNYDAGDNHRARLDTVLLTVFAAPEGGADEKKNAADPYTVEGCGCRRHTTEFDPNSGKTDKDRTEDEAGDDTPTMPWVFKMTVCHSTPNQQTGGLVFAGGGFFIPIRKNSPVSLRFHPTR